MHRSLDLPTVPALRVPPAVPRYAGEAAPSPEDRSTVVMEPVALDLLAVAIVCLDDHGQVLYLNLAARRLIATDDGIAVVRGRLAIDGRAGHLLRVLEGGDGGAFRAPRRSGKGDFAVIIRPAVGWAGDSATFLVSITDTADALPVRLDLLCQLWSLTLTEARVAAALAEGLTPAEIAARHRVCPATVRTQMRVVFEKTGTRRQAELVRLVLSCCGVL